MKRLMGNMLGVILLVAALVSAAGSLVVTYPNEYKLIRQFGDRPGDRYAGGIL